MVISFNRLERLAACGIAALVLCMPARAGTIDFEPVVGTIQGPSNTVVFTFDILGTGTSTFEAILTDLGSPAPFQLMGLGIADESTGIILFEDVGTGQLALTFDVNPGRYLALVGGLTDESTNIGTFGLEISNVPVPGAGLFLVSALLGSGLLMRGGANAPLA